MSAPRRRPVPLKLRQARAYWRLAGKAERAGQTKVAAHYRLIADRRYRSYDADVANLARIAQSRRTARAI